MTDAEAIELAHSEIVRLCAGGEWRMSIPANTLRDSDLIFGRVIRRLAVAKQECRLMSIAYVSYYSEANYSEILTTTIGYLQEKHADLSSRKEPQRLRILQT